MDPLIISGGLKLIGGLLGARSSRKARAIDAYNNSPQGIRANAEAAGFNPLVFAGPGTGTGATYAPQMGSIIANAFAGAADEVGKMRELEIANQQLELERDRLQQAVERATLQPNVGGIYEQRNEQGTVGVSSGDASNTAPIPVTGSDGIDRADPRGTGIYDTRHGPLRILRNPNTSGAEEVEERYGDVAQEGFGLATLFSDIGYTWGRNISQRRMNRYFAQLYDNVYPERVNRQFTDDARASRGFGRSPYGSGLWTN